jgi:hypothetical protein
MTPTWGPYGGGSGGGAGATPFTPGTGVFDCFCITNANEGILSTQQRRMEVGQTKGNHRCSFYTLPSVHLSSQTTVYAAFLL